MGLNDMCFFPRWYMPIPRYKVQDRHLKGYGYNKLNESFIVDCRNIDRFSYLVELYFKDNLDAIEKVPCGQCKECRLEYSKQWAQRCVAESTLHEHNYFVTLTYDEEHLTLLLDYTINRATGELGVFASLSRHDIEQFKKNLRQRLFRDYNFIGVRSYECGEYGSKNGRPHFHILLFNCPLPDLEILKSYDLKGQTITYMHSQIIEDCWNKGFITVGEVTWDSAAYVARYMLKKQKGQAEKDYQELCKIKGVTPQANEFTNGSRRPGIGRFFYEAHKDRIYDVDKVTLPNGYQPKPCRYFDNLYDLEDPQRLEELKSIRKRKAELRQIAELKYVKDVESYQNAKRESFERRLKKLVRKLDN